MKRITSPTKTLLSTAIAGLLASSASEAGSFALYTESSGAMIGNYAAGSAASALDASTAWYNPAGLILLPSAQLVLSGVAVLPSSELTGTSTYTSPAGLPGVSASYVQRFKDIQGAESAVVPALHYAQPLTPDTSFGISVVSPYGLTTSWGVLSPVRYEATDSKLVTVDVSPELAARVLDHLSLGLGIDFEYARVTFNSVIGSPALLQFTPLGPTAYDSNSTNKGHSFGVGFHAGALWLVQNDHTRVGLNYQSKVKQKFHGWSRLRGPLATSLPLTPFSDPNQEYWSRHLSSNSIEMPDVLTLSGYHDVNERLALLGSVVWTGWKSLSDIQLRNVAAFTSSTGKIQAVSNSVLDYKNTWRFALGANYTFNPKWMFRVGGGYDQTPTNNTHRDARIPDCSRWALAAGARFQAKPTISVDLGYAHLFPVGDTRINNTQALGTSTFNVNATADNSVDLVGVQVNWSMDDPVVMDTK